MMDFCVILTFIWISLCDSLQNVGMPDMKREFKVAYLGDSLVRPGQAENNASGTARQVLELIDSHLGDGDMVVHLGDLGYDNNPSLWTSMTESVINRDIAYFATPGEYRTEVENWDEYIDWMADHNPGIVPRCVCHNDNCYGDGDVKEAGVMQACVYGGILVIYTGYGLPIDARLHVAWNYDDQDYLDFIEEVFNKYGDETPWKVCAFHFARGKFTVSGHKDAGDEKLHELCRKHGAIIVGGNMHSYARTHLVNDFNGYQFGGSTWYETAFGDNKVKPVKIEKGKTISIVSGLGGASRHSNNGEANKAHWASTGAEDYPRAIGGIDYGALICTYYYEDDPYLAKCNFWEVGNTSPYDSFYLDVSEMAKTSSTGILPRAGNNGAIFDDSLITTCKDSNDWYSSYGDCESYEPGRRNDDHCEDDLGNNNVYAWFECPVACGVCDPNGFDLAAPQAGTVGQGADAASTPSTSSTPSASSTPSPSSTQSPFPQDDADGCVDDEDWESEYGKCETYADGRTNGGYCRDDRDVSTSIYAEVACPKSCQTCDDRRRTGH